jgi:hypothetical protein
MTNALTSDYETVFEIAIPQLNGLLGSRKVPSSCLFVLRIIRRIYLVADSDNHKCSMTSETRHGTLTLMAEWLILLLLVPAIVAPVVLVLGFAGCGFHGASLPLPEPTIDSATGTSFNTISVAWGINGTDPVTFQRTNLDNSVTDLGVQPASPFTDTVPAPTESDQNPPLVYQYQAANNALSPVDWSTAVSAKTFESTFDGMLNNQVLGSGWEGYTLVQRIEPGYPLSKSSTAIQILLQASTAAGASGASIDAIYISQADPNQPTQPWQPATDLMQVPLPAQPFVVPAGAAVTLPPVAYPMDSSKPLLVAFNFNVSTASSVALRISVPVTQAATYYFQGAEAALQTRSAGYTLAQDGDPTLSHVSFIANIYVFVV